MIARTDQEPLIVLPPGEKKPQPVVRSGYRVIEFAHNGHLWAVKENESDEALSLYTVKEHEFSNSTTYSLVVTLTKNSPLLSDVDDLSSIEQIARTLIARYAVERYQES